MVPKRSASVRAAFKKNAVCMTWLYPVCPRESQSRKMLLHVQKIPCFLDEKTRGSIQRNTVSLSRPPIFMVTDPVQKNFHSFHRIGPRVSLERTHSKANAPDQKRHHVFADKTQDRLRSFDVVSSSVRARPRVGVSFTHHKITPIQSDTIETFSSSQRTG